MASSFSQKSNSSASKAPKPTYRRAPAPGKAPAASARPSRTPAAGSRVPRSSGTAPRVKGAARPVAAHPATARPAGKGSAFKIPRPARPKKAPVSAVKSPAVRAAANKARAAASAARPQAAAPKVATPKVASPKAAAPRLRSPRPAGAPARMRSSLLRPIAGAFAAVGKRMGSLMSSLHIPVPSRAVVFVAAGGMLALLLAVTLVVNSSLFAATDIRVQGSAHLDQATAQALVEVPEGTTLLNVREDDILASLKTSPWVKGVTIEKQWPHTLVISPVERSVKALAYITSDELAWAIGDDGAWIAPVTLQVAVDAQDNEVALGEDGSVPEGATLLSSQDAAQRIARDAGCLLLTDVPSDVSPKSGEPVSSKVVLAGLEYANGFSAEFVTTIKSLSIASVEAISANLESGIEVSLGEPEHITEKERVITKLIEQEVGVTYINVREPGAYTFRSAPH